MSPLHPITTILILALLLAASAPARGATINVAPGVTGIAAYGECSLAEVINNANANAQIEILTVLPAARAQRLSPSKSRLKR